MASIRHVIFWCVAFSALSLAACSGADQPAKRGAPTAREIRMQKENDVLMDSASPFEDLIEFAVAGDNVQMDRVLGAIETRAGITQPVLESSSREVFDSLLVHIRAVQEAGIYREVALGSVEGYRVLVEGLHDEVLTVPKAVSLLDYAGFRLDVLAGSDTPDWDAIRVTAEEARGFWETIAGQVELNGLRDAMNTTIEGLGSAVDARDARMTGFAARIDLDLVDLLESYFEEHAPVAQ